MPSEPFIGQIMAVGFNFPPRGWAACEGQLLPINQNQALFSLLGTTYGGNGQTTFALPDLRGRVPISSGNGPGLTPHTLGERSGAASVTLLQQQLPSHNHPAATASPATGNAPATAMPAPGGAQLYGTPGAATLAADALTDVGGNQPHPNQQPYLGVLYVIALEGIFPSRN